jgi:peptidoglycan/xylan/chitin deacetylase (PgdA/CDA1 family)
MRSIPILMYHNIGQPAPEDRKPRLYVQTGAFARQMALLRMLGYRGISMGEAMPYLRGEAQGKVVVITFDDGYVETLYAALPSVQRSGHTATCYMVSQRMGQHNDWDAHLIGAYKPLMSKEQLLQWSAAGMEVGAHTQTHPHLPDCDEANLWREIAGSKEELEALLQKPVTQFCYPYGSLNSRVVEAVRKAGYVAATTTDRGMAEAGGDPYLLPRERPRVSRILFKIGLGLG